MHPLLILQVVDSVGHPLFQTGKIESSGPAFFSREFLLYT